ncbi:M48 family metallopeptidase [Nonomuraea basaltis]|uniref:M48 family metallopeptidase n=1 Tax=Nonomuraea basaltis TaxID=2495887 RepID=UPI00110C480D|nr:SprT family zinc-dependent metalloprotease [Nonomuraea basaltis]TMR94756.1 M48 family metallopeptidase [Nonomuraea basaltis]
MTAPEKIYAALAASGALKGLTWKIRVSQRRTLGLTIERDASVTVAVPPTVDPEMVAAFIRNRRPWLLKKSAQRAATLAAHPIKRIVSGENYPYLGRHQRLLVVSEQDVPIQLEGNWLRLRRMAPEAGAQAIVGWYRDQGRQWLTPRLDRWTGRLGIVQPAVDVRDLGQRWGLLDRTSGLAFHWALLQLDPSLVDYVIVHELAHYDGHHHGPEFWERVECILPDFAARKSRLAELGRTVWLGDVSEPTHAG